MLGEHSKRPLISICMTAYRRPTLAIHCLLACLAQDYRPLDIDISDDSPTEDTERNLAVIVNSTDITLRYHRNTPALGESGNVNSLFENARGEYLVLIHDDDVLLPGAVTTLWAALSASSGATAAFGTQEIILNSGELQPEYTTENGRLYKREAKNAGPVDPLCSALQRQFPNNGYLIETKVARAILYRSRLEAGGAGDTDFGIRLAKSFPQRPFIFVARPVSQYRLTYGNNSSTLAGQSLMKLYENVLQMKDLNSAQTEARRDLLRNFSLQAVNGYAINGNRLGAMKILCSEHYAPFSRPLKALYHLALIALPKLHRLKSMMKAALR